MNVLLRDVPSDDIVRLTLNRPEKLNALNVELLERIVEELQDAIEQHRRVLIFGGAGRAFTSGIDLDEDSDGGDYLALLQEITRLTNEFPGIVIGALDGYVIGGGFEFTLSFDLRYASEAATFQMTESEIGATISNASTVLLPLVVGYGTAKELVYTGRPVDAEEARELGLVADVFNRDELDDAVLDVAKDISRNKSHVALQLNKRGFARAFPIADALEYERLLDVERQILDEPIARRSER